MRSNPCYAGALAPRPQPCIVKFQIVAAPHAYQTTLRGSVSGLAEAGSMPIVGVARSGEAQFGGVSVSVPLAPLWATIPLAVALWVVVYLMRNKEI